MTKYLLALVIALLPLAAAAELDNTSNLQKLKGKQLTLWAEVAQALLPGSAELHGEVLAVFESSMTINVRFMGENLVPVHSNIFFLSVLGSNAIDPIDITDEGATVTLLNSAVLLAQTTRSKVVRVLTLGLLPKEKDVYVRTDILRRVGK